MGSDISLNPLLIRGTDKTPQVHFDANIGLIEIKWNWTINLLSKPINALEFEKPLIDWLAQYIKNPSKHTIMVAHFENLETSGSLGLLNVFKKLENIYRNKNQMDVYWYYKEGNENMLEQGEDFASIIRVPFQMISYQVEQS
jgi:hypothetical protein